MLCLRNLSWRTSSSAICNPPSQGQVGDDSRLSGESSLSGASRSADTIAANELESIAAVFEFLR